MTEPNADQILGTLACWGGFNLFLSADLQGILAVPAGEHQISGLSSRRLQRLLPQWTRSQIGRLLRRLRLQGLIRKVGKTTNNRQRVLASAFCWPA